MREFHLKGHNGSLRISALKDFEPNAGADSTAVFALELKNEGFSVTDKFHSNLGDFIELRLALTRMHKELAGSHVFGNSYDNNFTIRIDMATGGHTKISGEYWKIAESRIHLDFEIKSDQSFLTEALSELQQFCEGL
jgi:hypothetical protein